MRLRERQYCRHPSGSSDKERILVVPGSWCESCPGRKNPAAVAQYSKTTEQSRVNRFFMFLTLRAVTSFQQNDDWSKFYSNVGRPPWTPPAMFLSLGVQQNMRPYQGFGSLRSAFAALFGFPLSSKHSNRRNPLRQRRLLRRDPNVE